MALPKFDNDDLKCRGNAEFAVQNLQLILEAYRKEEQLEQSSAYRADKSGEKADATTSIPVSIATSISTNQGRRGIDIVVVAPICN